MRIDKKTGILDIAEYIHSPNCDTRPKNCEITLLVIHNISLPPGKFGGPHISQLFTNCLNPKDDPFFEEICHLKVSSHLLIRRDGSITQYVPFQQRAWHAGVSEYNGQTHCNDYSIGIELEGTDTEEYEAEQYKVLAKITQEILKTYPGIKADRITGHSNIAPERKTDPGPAFKWAQFLSMLNPNDNN